jgi:hypothetical protein
MNTSKILLFAITYLLLFAEANCKKDKDCHREITIINKSNQDVIRAFNMKNTSNNCNLSGSIIKSGDSYKQDSRECWENVVSDTKPYDLYIIDTAKYNAPTIFYSCDSIEIKNKVLKHYVLTLDDLKKNNFTVTYP